MKEVGAYWTPRRLRKMKVGMLVWYVHPSPRPSMHRARNGRGEGGAGFPRR